MIITEQAFLTKEECGYLINLHCKYFDTVGFYHRDTKVIDFDSIIQESIAYDVRSKISNYIKTIDRNVDVGLCELVEWPIDSYQVEHCDFDYNPLTSIIYLNDDFAGGRTIIEDTVVTPKVGQIVTFAGNKLKHQVTTVFRNHRFTIPVWYKKINL